MSDRTHPSARPASKTLLNLGNLPPKRDRFVSSNGEFPRTASHINPNNPPWPAYRGYHEYSFAHETMGRRLPTILGKALDDVLTTVNQQWDEEKIIDLLKCVDRMKLLMHDLQTNAKLRPIIDDGEGDIPLWNREIARYFRDTDFMSAPWLFAEAYKYRRLHECFSVSRYWKDYDVFFRQKCDTFGRSGTAVFELSTRFAVPYESNVPASTPEERHDRTRKLFLELTQISVEMKVLIEQMREQVQNVE